MSKKITAGAIAVFLLVSVTACGKESGTGNTGNNNKTEVPGVPSEAVNTWIVNSTGDVSGYKSGVKANTRTLHMARGEAEHFQLVIETAQTGTVTFQRHDPQTGISMEVKRIASFDGVADVLVPVPDGTSTSDKIVKLWLTFETTVDTPPGEYDEVITFGGDSGETVIGVKIVVYDVVIPQTPSITALFGIKPENVATGISGSELTAKQREFADMLLARRITPYFCEWVAGTMKTECYTSPYPVNDNRTFQYLNDQRLKDIVLPYHTLSSEVFTTMMGNLAQKVPGKGQIFYVWDEPTKLTEYESIKTMADDIHSRNSDARIITTFYRGPTDPDNTNFNDVLSVWDNLRGYTSIFCTGVWSLQQNEYRSQQCLLKCTGSEEWWTYVCMGDRPGLAHSSTAVENRAVLWRSYKEQPKGFLFWVVNSFDKISPLTHRSGLPSGDGELIYPAEAFGSGTPAVSMRLERFRDGAEDYELLLLLEQATSREYALELLDNVYKSPKSNDITTNPAYVEAFKKKLLADITKQ